MNSINGKLQIFLRRLDHKSYRTISIESLKNTIDRLYPPNVENIRVIQVLQAELKQSVRSL